MKTRRMAVLVTLALCWGVVTGEAAEAHVAGVISNILANVQKLKAANPAVRPMAFWDFDGTILKGDISEGLVENGVECYQGLVHAGIQAGFSPFYQGEEGCRQFDCDYARLNKLGRFIAWPWVGQAFAGVSVTAFGTFCEQRIRTIYCRWYFTSSLAILQALEAAGVENHIISGSPSLFVKNAAKSIGLTPDRMHGISLAVDGDVLSTRIHYPITTGEGKVDLLRQLLLARTPSVAVAGFGDSYLTDGAFLRFIRRQVLPGGATGSAVMINVSRVPPDEEGLFTRVTQTEVVGEQASGLTLNFK